MAEGIQYERDIDPDQTWFHWGDVLSLDPKCVPWIVGHLPMPRTPADWLLRTLGVHQWLRDSTFEVMELMIGFDEDGRVAFCPHGHPFLQLEVKLEDMSTRPERICVETHALATSQPELARQQVSQWLPWSGEVDIEEIIRSYPGAIEHWARELHILEKQWFASEPLYGDVMGVVVMESEDGGQVRVWEALDELVSLPYAKRNALLEGQTQSCPSILRDALPEHDGVLPGDLAGGTTTAYFAAPSVVRRAELLARKMDQQTTPVSTPGRGGRL